MFVIVPSTRQTSHVASEDDRGPTRTQNACDACRLRKVKCNGVQPCGRCRARRLVCTYARAIPEFTAPVSAQRAEALRNQNSRLERAVRCMAARIQALERSLPDGNGHQHLGQGPSQPSCGDSQANIADLLNSYAPEDADSADRFPSNDETPSHTSISLDGKAKKRRVEEIADRHTDFDMAQSFPPFAIAPANAYQDPTTNNALVQNTEVPVDSAHLGGSTGLAPMASQDATRQAFQTLLQISQARRERSIMGAQIPEIGPATSDVPLAPPEYFGQTSSCDVPYTQPDHMNSTVSGNMEDSLLDLIDWDETLQSFMPMSSMDWHQGFE